MIIAKIITAVLGAVSIGYGIIVISMIGTGSVFNFAFLAVGIVLVAVGVFLDKILKLNKWVLIATGVVLLAVLVDFSIFEIKLICTATESRSVEASDGYVIVLGARIGSDGNPKTEFAARLIRAEEICTDKNVLILTGGQGDDEPISEAKGGCLYLEARKKVQAADILLEDKSTSTYENLKNALDIIVENGGNCDEHIVIVTSEFHLYRAKKIAEKVGFTNIDIVGANGMVWLVPFYYVREYAASTAAGIR